MKDKKKNKRGENSIMNIDLISDVNKEIRKKIRRKAVLILIIFYIIVFSIVLPSIYFLESSAAKNFIVIAASIGSLCFFMIMMGVLKYKYKEI